MTRPLDDVKVVELASFVAAPSAGAVMADLGADVIKIEPPTGDPYRGLMRSPKINDQRVDFDAAFAVDNRGKRSLAVDVSTEAGQTLMHRLIADSNVFMCNMLPNRQQRFGLDPESLKAVNSSLVHATLTGYGTLGEEADRPGYDVTAYFARGGFADLSSDPETGQPARFPQAVGDHSTGLAFLGGILAALRLAERTGEFQVIETSLLASALWGIAGDLATVLVDGRVTTPRGRKTVVNASVNSYPCKDGRWIMVNMPVPTDFPDFCRAIGMDELLEDSRFVTPRDRFQNMSTLVELIDQVMVTRSADEWGAAFDEAKIVWAPVQAVTDVARDKQARANGYIVPLGQHIDTSGDGAAVNSSGQGQPIETVAAPIKIAGGVVGPGGSAPSVGADTDSILVGLGLSDQEISELRADGTVA